MFGPGGEQPGAGRESLDGAAPIATVRRDPCGDLGLPRERRERAATPATRRSGDATADPLRSDPTPERRLRPEPTHDSLRMHWTLVLPRFHSHLASTTTWILA